MKIKQTILFIGVAVALAIPLLVSQPALAAECAGVRTALLDCGEATGQDAIMYLLKLVIQIMTYGVGILAVIGIVIASLLYTSAGGAPEQVKKAKTIILNVVIGLVMYTFLFAITNFLIPGGVFNNTSNGTNPANTPDRSPNVPHMPTQQ